ncbi:aldose 1-epimerase family protein [Rhizobium leguminosarum]|uniref:aldose 1-epimerase family protein n=1 Tax=Rhizobium leguminosarum TaxID=384 RepID=UPI001C988445|nr:aldose 1-epimerase family protein [Rhizobium leguminosarum]MBY5406430.1 aldose 1-epimerase family protein [Rhizobium leguminosarum]
MVIVQNEFLRAEFTLWRAELVRLCDQQGREFLWDGNPEVWKGSSPILFPIVGMVPNDHVTIGGRSYSLRQHGFAPSSEFYLIHAEESRCVFQLEASDATRQLYPFDFCLDVAYELIGKTLKMIATVANRSPEVMPYSFGFHPGFRWPLPGAGERLDQFVEFETDESAPIRRPLEGLLDPKEYPSPVTGRRIALRDELFVNGAMMFTDLNSRRLRYGSEYGPYLDVAWRDLPHLGIWSKPMAGYLCIEPWQGFPAPADFAGELRDKPGMLELPPGEERDFEMSITVVDRP